MSVVDGDPTHWTFLQIFDTVLAAGMLFHADHHGDFCVGVEFFVANKTAVVS